MRGHRLGAIATTNPNAQPIQPFLGLGAAYAWGRQKVQDYQRYRALRAQVHGTNPTLATHLDRTGSLDEAEWLADLGARDPDLADARGPTGWRPGAWWYGFQPQLHIPIPANAAVNAPRIHALATSGHPQVQVSGGTLHTGLNLYQLNELHHGILGELYGEAPQPIQHQHAADPLAAAEAAFGNRTAGAQRQQARVDLLRQSYRRTNEFDYAAYDQQFDAREHSRLSKVGRKVNPADYLLNTRGYEGFAIGEGHGDSASKGFLIQHAAALQQAGVDTLYLEHIRADHQALLDQYFDPNYHGPIPPDLARIVAENDADHGLAGHALGHNLAGVLAAAKAQNLRVKSIDSLAAQSIPPGPDGHDLRAITMNVFGEQVVRNDAGRQGKYVILAGQAHNQTHARNNNVPQGFQQGLPGFSQLLNIPAITVDAGTGRARYDQENPANRA